MIDSSCAPNPEFLFGTSHSQGQIYANEISKFHISRIPRLEMSLGLAGKAVINEGKYPFIIEVPVAANGLDVELNGQIVGFHRSRRVAPRFGRTVLRGGQRYYRWCFSDLETARAFIAQFGGAFYKTTGT
jgi:hypothetical protein